MIGGALAGIPAVLFAFIAQGLTAGWRRCSGFMDAGQ